MNKVDVKAYAVVPAAGIGSRMQSEIPKQYLKIKGKTILEYTLETLASVNFIEQVVVPTAFHDDRFNELTISQNNKIRQCRGGDERHLSVLNGLNYLIEQGVSEYSWVLVHDVARPCIRKQELQTLFQSRSEEGALLALEVRDTMKRTNQDNYVVETVDRTQLWQAQTPQIAPLGILANAIEICIKDNITITDESSALEYMGLYPKVIAGHPSNLKITRPEDLELASFFLGGK